jgi:hypothetical protein
MATSTICSAVGNATFRRHNYRALTRCRRRPRACISPTEGQVSRLTCRTLITSRPWSSLTVYHRWSRRRRRGEARRHRATGRRWERVSGGSGPARLARGKRCAEPSIAGLRQASICCQDVACHYPVHLAVTSGQQRPYKNPPMGAPFVKSARWSGPVTCGRRAGGGACSSGFPRSCRVLCRRAPVGQAGAPAAAQRRGRTSLTPASGGRSFGSEEEPWQGFAG